MHGISCMYDVRTVLWMHAAVEFTSLFVVLRLTLETANDPLSSETSERQPPPKLEWIVSAASTFSMSAVTSVSWRCFSSHVWHSLNTTTTVRSFCQRKLPSCKASALLYTVTDHVCPLSVESLAVAHEKGGTLRSQNFFVFFIRS